MNDIIEEFMILMGTNHKLTLSYSKEENAMVENANKRIQEYQRDLMFERRIIKKMVTRTTLRTAHTDDREKRGDKSYTRRTAIW